MRDEQPRGKPRLSDENLARVASAIESELSDSPPTIGLVGVSGVGKSSTINSLFRTRLPTSDTVACTKEFRDVALEVDYRDKNVGPRQVALTVVDAPGLGEDIAADESYLRMYEQNLERCDVVLWVMSARNRAVALDQQYLRRLAPFHDRMVLGVNQVDVIEPLDWLERYNMPSAAQERNMREIEADRRARIRSAIGRDLPVVSYSARRGYELQTLFTTLLKSCRKERRWIYAGLKNFDYTDFLPARMTEGAPFRAAGLITRLFGRQSEDGSADRTPDRGN